MDAALAEWPSTGLAEEDEMDMSASPGGDLRPRRSLIPLFAVTAILVAACGTAATQAPKSAPSQAESAAPATPAPTAAPTSAPTAAESASATPAGTPSVAACAGEYTGPEASIQYSVWGDPTELKNHQAIVDAFEKANPKITVNVTVSDWNEYWPKLQTSLAAGSGAPDVFVMDGPYFPDYQSRGQLLDVTPLIQRDGYDVSQLADLAVQDFTAPDGHLYGLPRDQNVVALYYNKKMFDAAGVPYPDDSWDWNKLLDVSRQLTKDTSGDGKPDQWGLYTETGDMENYWASLVWQNGGDILSADKKTNLLGTDQAAGGIQFLQDLIWKDKVVPEPLVVASAGDMFSMGQAAMEANGSWLVATQIDAGIDFGIAPLPKGPAGRATSVNPTGAVIYKGTPAHDAAWQLVKYLSCPEAQEMMMTLKASMPVNKAVLEGPYAGTFDGAKVFADALAYAHLKPSFKGYNEWFTALQTDELDPNVFQEPNETARQAIDKVLPGLDQILANPGQ
jgi:multiple sugar transport system substrate-binding protein